MYTYKVKLPNNEIFKVTSEIERTPEEVDSEAMRYMDHAGIKYSDPRQMATDWDRPSPVTDDTQGVPMHPLLAQRGGSLKQAMQDFGINQPAFDEITAERVIEGTRPYAKTIGGGLVGGLIGMTATPAGGLAAGIGTSQLIDSAFDYARQLAGVDEFKSIEEVLKQQGKRLKANTEEELVGDLGLRALGLIAKTPGAWVLSKIMKKSAKTPSKVGKELFNIPTNRGVIPVNRAEAERLQELTGVQFTTAQQRGDYGSLVVEKGALQDIKTAEDFKDLTKKNTERLDKYLNDSLGSVGEEELKGFAKESRQKIMDFTAGKQQEIQLDAARQGAKVEQNLTQNRQKFEQDRLRRQAEQDAFVAERQAGFEQQQAKRQSAVDEATPQNAVDSYDTGSVLRNEYASGLEAIKQQEDLLYKDIPEFHIPNLGTNIRKNIAKISERMPGSPSGQDIPELFAKHQKLLDEVDDNVTVSELRGMLSTTKDAMSRLKAAEGSKDANPKELKRLVEYHDKLKRVFDDIADGKGYFTDAQRDVKEAISKATTLTRQKFDKYYGDTVGGKIGKTLGYGRHKLAEEKIGDSVFKTGNNGAVSTRQFMNTFGESPSAMKAMNDHIDTSFINKVKDLKSFRKWKKDHGPALKNLGLENKYATWETAQDSFERAALRHKDMEVSFANQQKALNESFKRQEAELKVGEAEGNKTLGTIGNIEKTKLAEVKTIKDQFESSYLAKVIGEEPDLIMSDIVNPTGSLSKFKSMLRQVKGNSQAEEAFKNSYIRELVRQSKEVEKGDAFVETFHGQYKKMKTLLHQHRRALEAIKKTDPDKVQALNEFHKTLDVLSRSEAPIRTEGKKDMVDEFMRLVSTGLSLKKRRPVNLIRGALKLEKHLDKDEFSELFRRAMFDPELAYNLKYLGKGDWKEKFHLNQLMHRFAGRTVDTVRGEENK